MLRPLSLNLDEHRRVSGRVQTVDELRVIAEGNNRVVWIGENENAPVLTWEDGADMIGGIIEILTQNILYRVVAVLNPR